MNLKKSDLIFVGIFLFLFVPFFLSDKLYNWYILANDQHGMWMSFAKFAILATMGEALGLRIKTGYYNAMGFGLLPRAFVWGFLGLTIKLAFVVFASGSPVFLSYLGMESAPMAIKSKIFTLDKLLTAFSISVLMNMIYAPVMMTLHKITDTHIVEHGGRMVALLKPIRFAQILRNINWDVQWNFVFKKTIPFFWIPAHTITFILPSQFQVLFAALLGIVLGVILSVAAKSNK